MPALVSLLLKVIREPRFPKKHEAQFGVLADSLAGRAGLACGAPVISADRSARKRRITSSGKIITSNAAAAINAPLLTANTRSAELTSFL